MSYKIKSLFYLSCFILVSFIYHNYISKNQDEKEYASLEEVRISHENLKKVSEEVLKDLQ